VTVAHRYPTRADWLAHRRIGSSDVSAILGLSRYRSEWDVLLRLKGELSEGPSSPAADRGRLLEPVVLRRYGSATGRQVRPTPPNTLWTRDEWASATPDAFADGEIVLEAKTDARRERWGEPQTIERWEPGAELVVRPDYYLQVQHQLWVLDLELADLAVLVPGDDPFLPELRIFRLHRDEEVVAAVVDRLSTWWQRHVVAGEPPELDGSASAGRWLASWPNLGGERAATPGEVALAAGYEMARRNARAWEEARNRYGQLLVAAAGGVRRLALPRGRVTVVRNSGRTRLDEAALLSDHPELGAVLELYRRRTEASVFPRISGLET